MAHILDQTDPTFVADLRESRNAVHRASEWLASLGYPTMVMPSACRPDPSQMSDFSDDGDLQVVMRVEVKRRNINFTAGNFPYPTIIVDVAHTWDNASPKPLSYIIFNQDMTSACVVPGHTSTHWVKTKKHDTHKNRERVFYECPTEHAKWIDL